MKNIYFVQTGCVCNNEYFLPYATGILAAYAMDDADVADNFNIAGFIYKSDDIDATFSEIQSPDVIAFSCYMWNWKFNIQLAEKIKAAYPDCKILFGGHQINDGVSWMEQYPFIDVITLGEGEPALRGILRSFLGLCDINTVPNVVYRLDGKITETERQSICIDVNTYPSPYLKGLFDDLINNSTDRFAAILETNRGCPHHCSYCDWGDYSVKMRKFNKDRVKAELEWLGKMHIQFFVIADSNFGIFPEDEEYVDKLIETKVKYGYPKGMTVAFTKNSSEKIFRMNKKLFESGLSRGATLSMQTLSEAALENIGRKNISIQEYMKLIKLYNENGIPAYTELILGLPGETYDSFCDGIETLLENGQHNSIRVFLCEILPNADMGSADYLEKYGIKFVERDFVMRAGNTDVGGISGSSKIIVETNTMSLTELCDSLFFSFIIQVFHNYGLLRYISIYLYDKYQIKYVDFYKNLISRMRADESSFIGKIINIFWNIHYDSLCGKCSDTYYNEKFGNVQYNLTDGAFLELVSDYEQFYNEIPKYFADYMNSDDKFKELIEFQKAAINCPVDKERQTVINYNWIEYFNDFISMNPFELKRGDPKKLISNPDISNGNILDYAENVVIKGRRIGASILLNNPDLYSLEDM